MIYVLLILTGILVGSIMESSRTRKHLKKILGDLLELQDYVKSYETEKRENNTSIQEEGGEKSSGN